MHLPTLKTAAVEAYVDAYVGPFYGANCSDGSVGEDEEWSIDVVFQDITGWDSPDPQCFWKPLVDRLHRGLDERLAPYIVELIPGRERPGFVLIADHSDVWPKRGYSDQCIDPVDPCRLLQSAVLVDCLSYKIGKKAGILTFRAQKNTPIYFMMTLRAFFDSAPAYSRTVCTRGLPPDSEYIWKLADRIFPRHKEWRHGHGTAEPCPHSDTTA